MQELIDAGLINEIRNEHYVGYILARNNFFYNTVYQIMRKSAKDGLLRCYVSKNNGKIKLIYDTEGYRQYDSIVDTLNETQFMELIYRFLLTLEKIKKNGFIQIETLDISVDKVFVDVHSMEIGIICLPVIFNYTGQTQNFSERKILKTLSAMLYQSEFISNYYMMQLFEDCRTEQYLLDDICGFLRNGRYGDSNLIIDEVANESQIRLICNADQKNESILIQKDYFVLGKSETQCDSAILSSPNVSRKHCALSREIDGWYVQDLDSTNGTYINGTRVMNGEKLPVHHGDEILIADVPYIVD